jgi:hypothetical protein
MTSCDHPARVTITRDGIGRVFCWCCGSGLREANDE